MRLVTRKAAFDRYSPDGHGLGRYGHGRNESIGTDRYDFVGMGFADRGSAAFEGPRKIDLVGSVGATRYWPSPGPG
ncbi:hypothetical protein Scani_68360 [Streptomyces caniferus]|uniref:Uncharacterized protein n=1 Tax=Streptomyces caniferus TaxID=285557 RepID=A0A640SHJ2_9ACTN|nr:hypothetical protein Scani_68360 [Streptomyces caniferus]